MTANDPDESSLTTELRRHRCNPRWDYVASDPETTNWKRRARLHQARWRKGQGLPIGHQPYRGGPDAGIVGNRIELGAAKAGGHNFLTPSALAAAKYRLANPEPHQMLNEDRLWADLLSSMPMCFNLFGEIAMDESLARSAVRGLWPDAPEGRVRVKFEHSPGRGDPKFLANRSAFDAAIEIETDAGLGIIGIETKYHEHAKREKKPRSDKLERLVEVTEAAGIFKPGWRQRLVGTELQQIWQDHLLVLSMLQHPSRRLIWGRFVLVYPADNPNFRRLAIEYDDLLREKSTYKSQTLEQLIDAPDALPITTTQAFRDRYLLNFNKNECPPSPVTK